MKIKIKDNLIIITPPPKRNKKNGIKICFWRNPSDLLKHDMPIASTDIKKGKGKYDLPSLEGFDVSIKSIEF